MSTTITTEDVIAVGKGSSLTAGVLADWAAKGTPKQREYLHGLLQAEHASRRAARHARLLKAARLPTVKTLEGYDWTNLAFPADYGREQLTSLEFLQCGGDLVFYGDVGTGKTHLAAALVAQACREGIPARFFTTAALVAQLRRAQEAERLDKELAALAKNQLLVLDLCRACNYAEDDSAGPRGFPADLGLRVEGEIPISA